MGTVNAKITKEFYEEAESLPAQAKAELIEAVIRYRLYGEYPNLSGDAKAMFDIETSDFKRAQASRENGRKGGRPRKAETSYSEAKKGNFPAFDEIAEYIAEHNINVDPQAFYLYYDARGWRTKQNEVIKNWKSMVRYWEANTKKHPKMHVAKSEPSEPCDDQEREMLLARLKS